VFLLAGCEEGAVGGGEGIAFTPCSAGTAAFPCYNCYRCACAEEEKLFDLDGHFGGRARSKSEIVSEAGGGVGRRELCGVSVSVGGIGAIATATDRDPTENWLKDEGE
jgi:hypothetical protein